MSNTYTPPDRCKSRARTQEVELRLTRSFLTATYDPGWNDPPPMPTNAAPNPNRAKLGLNKRVAFPLQTQSQGMTAVPSDPTAASGLPLPFSKAKYQPPTDFKPTEAPSPVVFNPPPPPPPANATQTTLTSAPPTTAIEEQSSEENLEAAFEFSQKVFARLIENMITTIDSVRSAEIQKRLDLMISLWSDKKLSRDVQLVLWQIAKGVS